MVYINKWHTFAAASLLQLVGGICYTFSLYSPELKRQLNYDQRQLQAVGAAILAGGYTSWIPGLLYDGLVQRHHKLAPRCAEILWLYYSIYLAPEVRSGCLSGPASSYAVLQLNTSNKLATDHNLNTCRLMACLGILFHVSGYALATCLLAHLAFV